MYNQVVTNIPIGHNQNKDLIVTKGHMRYVPYIFSSWMTQFLLWLSKETEKFANRIGLDQFGRVGLFFNSWFGSGLENWEMGLCRLVPDLGS